MSLEWIRLIKPQLLPHCSTQAVVRNCRGFSKLNAAGRPSAAIVVATENLAMAMTKPGSRREGKWASGLVLPAEPAHVHDAAEALKDSQVIAVPTDTLYGFACDACSENAVQKIYNIKGRSCTRPLAICVADVDDIQLYGSVRNVPDGLLAAIFPGPVTLILPREDSSLLDSSLNPGLASIGVRIPDDLFIRSLCRAAGGALALTSANLSSQPSTVSVEEFRHLWEHCSFIFDAGQLPAGRAGSTIVDLTLPGNYRVVRDGSALRETQEILSTFGLTERTEEEKP